MKPISTNKKPVKAVTTIQPAAHGKPCAKCGNTLRYLGKSGCNNRCVACHQQWRRDNEWRYYRKWGSSLFRKLGLTMARYLEICEDQEWRCAICKKVPKKGLCVDHCHKENVYRGLLCGSCNKGLGFFKDDPERLQAAIEYLRAC